MLKRYVFIALSSSLLIAGCDDSTKVPTPPSGVVQESVPYDQILQNWNAFQIGEEYMYEDPSYKGIVEGKVNNGTKLYKDIDIKKNQIIKGRILVDDAGIFDGREIQLTLQNLLSVANLFYIKNSSLFSNPYYRDAKVFDKVSLALDSLLTNFYTEKSRHDGNWWYWEIGANKLLMNLIALTQKDLKPALLAKALAVSRYMAPDPNFIFNSPGTASNRVPEKATGANRIDLGQIALVRGLLERNLADVTSAITTIEDTLAFTTAGDGFYTDGSVIQHNDYPYVGGYGVVLLEGISRIYYALSKTRYQFDLADFGFIYEIVFSSFEPVLFKSQIVEGVRGRSPSRGWVRSRKEAQTVVQSMLRLYDVAPPQYKARLGSLIKEHLLSPDQNRPHYFIESYANDFVSLGIARNTILKDQSIVARGNLQGNYLFHHMDRVVHRMDSWLFSVSAHSNRIANYECINGENLQGWRTGDGMTYLYDTDQEQYFNYWPMFDSLLPPGTTEIISKVPKDCTNMAEGKTRKQNMVWVGGVSTREVPVLDKSYGVFGMQFFSYDDDLSIKKSWFMFDDEIVALGSDLSSQDMSTTKTAVDFRKIKSSAGNKITIDGAKQPPGLTEINYTGQPKWVFVEGDITSSSRGYIFPNGADVALTRDIKEARSWATVNKENALRMGNMNVTYNTISLNIEHSSGKKDYSYILLPNTTDTAVMSYAASPDVTILENSNVAHIVRENSLRLLAANIWAESGATNEAIVTSSSASIMVHDDDKKVYVWLSNPVRDSKTLKVSLPLLNLGGVTKDASSIARLIDKNTFSVDTATIKGSTYFIEFDKLN